jgi:hypothetical protein
MSSEDILKRFKYTLVSGPSHRPTNSFNFRFLLSSVNAMRDFLDLFTLEDWADRLSRNVGIELPLYAV